MSYQGYHDFDVTPHLFIGSSGLSGLSGLSWAIKGYHGLSWLILGNLPMTWPKRGSRYTPWIRTRCQVCLHIRALRHGLSRVIRVIIRININIHERCQFTHPKDYSPRVIRVFRVVRVTKAIGTCINERDMFHWSNPHPIVRPVYIRVIRVITHICEHTSHAQRSPRPPPIHRSTRFTRALRAIFHLYGPVVSDPTRGRADHTWTSVARLSGLSGLS